jgi:hypothetical protein
MDFAHFHATAFDRFAPLLWQTAAAVASDDMIAAPKRPEDRTVGHAMVLPAAVAEKVAGLKQYGDKESKSIPIIRHQAQEADVEGARDLPPVLIP